MLRTPDKSFIVMRRGVFRLNWDAIGASAEIVGAIAVFLTLMYLSVQIRHTRDEIQRTAQGNRYSAFRELWVTSSQNMPLAEALGKLPDNLDLDNVTMESIKSDFSLTKAEWHLINSSYMAWWIYRVETIENIDLLTKEQKASFDFGCVSFYGGNGMSAFWYKGFREMYTDSASIRYVDSVLNRKRIT